SDRAVTSAFATLSGDRVRLRQWRAADREAFAAMNSDARVMEFFPSRLSRRESDAMGDRIQEHFSKRGFGLWALEVPGVAPFIGSPGWAVPAISAHFLPWVEVGGRRAFAYGGRGYATGAGRRALGSALATRALAGVVSSPPAPNRRSRAVMERLGMR